MVSCLCRNRRFGKWDFIFGATAVGGCFLDLMQIAFSHIDGAVDPRVQYLALSGEIIFFLAGYIAADNMGGTSNPLRACCNSCVDLANHLHLVNMPPLVQVACKTLAILKQLGKFDCPSFRIA